MSAVQASTAGNQEIPNQSRAAVARDTAPAKPCRMLQTGAALKGKRALGAGFPNSDQHRQVGGDETNHREPPPNRVLSQNAPTAAPIARSANNNRDGGGNGFGPGGLADAAHLEARGCAHESCDGG